MVHVSAYCNWNMSIIITIIQLTKNKLSNYLVKVSISTINREIGVGQSTSRSIKSVTIPVLPTLKPFGPKINCWNLNNKNNKNVFYLISMWTLAPFLMGENDNSVTSAQTWKALANSRSTSADFNPEGYFVMAYVNCFTRQRLPEHFITNKIPLK